MAIPGLDVSERDLWSRADSQAFGKRPQGAVPTTGARIAEGAQRVAQMAANPKEYADAAAATRKAVAAANPAAPSGTLRQTAGAVLRRAGPALDAGVEGVDVYRVAQDPNATGIDVGTQAAEGAARVGSGAVGAVTGAKAGAALGLLGGPAAPLTVPIGGVLGGIGGYVGGQWLGNKAIESGREALGTDTTPPIDRTAQGSLKSAARGAFASRDLSGLAPTGQPPTVANPAITNPTDARLADGSQAAPMAPEKPNLRGEVYDENGNFRPNVILRKGNSYSGGVVGPNAQMYNQAANGDVTKADFGGGFISGDSPALGAQRAAGALRADVPQTTSQDLFRQANFFMNRGQLGDARRAEQLMSAATSMANNESSAAAQRYSSDQTAATAREGHAQSAAQARATAANSAARLRYDMAKDARDFVAGEATKQNELDIKNADRTLERFAINVRTPDGKVVRDEGATTKAIAAVDKIMPGYSTMGEEARKKADPMADALFNIYSRTRAGKTNGIKLFAADKPELDSLPNFKGGKLKRAGVLGALPGQGGMDNYYVSMPDGSEVQLGADLAQNEIDMIRANTQTGKWTDPRKKD